MKNLAALILAMLCSLQAHAGETRIAVAANFTAPMKAIAAEFEKTTGHSLQLSFGSSGKLYAQIRNGAPFDAFFSADAVKPQALIDANQAVATSHFTYAVGQLVLWGKATADAKALLSSGDYHKLALANPRLAPYGAAAIDVLEHLKLLDSAKLKLVTAENISQCYQFIASGNADIGFVALSQIIHDGQTPENAWQVPAALHTPILQDAVLLNRGANNPASIALLQFMQSERGKQLITRFGYGISEHAIVEHGNEKH